MDRVASETRTGCGVACVAMLLDLTFEEAAEVVGKSGCTKTKDLVKALREHGHTCPDRLQVLRKGQPLPELALAKLKCQWHRPSQWHWVIVHGDEILNPSTGSRVVNKRCRITSVLPITRDASSPDPG